MAAGPRFADDDGSLRWGAIAAVDFAVICLYQLGVIRGKPNRPKPTTRSR